MQILASKFGEFKNFQFLVMSAKLRYISYGGQPMTIPNKEFSIFFLVKLAILDGVNKSDTF